MKKLFCRYTSARRLGEKVKITYPEDYVVKKVSRSGHITHQGHHCYLGEIYAGCRVGLYTTEQEVIQLHFANLHLGDLVINAGADPFRPPAYMARPQRNASTPRKANNK